MRIGVQACGSSFDDLADDVWAMMNQIAGEECFASHAPRSWRPNVNVYEVKDRFVICVELAGMSPDQIDVQVDPEKTPTGGCHLKIRGDRPKPAIPDGDGEVSVLLMEIDSGRFSRKVPLPPDADVNKCSAVYRQGYLWIVLPRSPQPTGSNAP